MIVVDASVLGPAIIDDDDVGEAARAALVDHELHAPDGVFPETMSYWRNTARGRQPERLDAARHLLSVLPLTSHPYAMLLDRMWELRHSCSTYDAAYVALAEAMDVPLATADRKLARSARRICEVRLVASSR